jgi:hypothetical protein
MKTKLVYLAVIVGVGLAAYGVWYFLKTSNPPMFATPPNPPQWSRPPGPAQASSYQNLTPEQWGRRLESPDHDRVLEACRSLWVLGPQGRPYLIQGLDSPSPETRRLCLETLTVSDLRTIGEPGRQLLVKLSGDPADIRIRERAHVYLGQWHRAVPAPP